MRRLLILVALSACVGSPLNSNSRTLRHINRAGIGAALAATACDYGTTLYHSRRGWEGGYAEGNPALPSQVDPTTLTIYFVGVMGATLLVNAVLPEKVRPALYVPLTGREAFSATRNTMQMDSPVCGVL